MQADKVFAFLAIPIKRPILFVPFLLVYLVKWLYALLLFYAVQWPLNKVFGPIIARFWGPVALHYPGHIFWMYSLLKSSGWFFDVILLSVASLFVVVMLWNYLKGFNVRVRLGVGILYVLVYVLIFFLGQKAFPSLIARYIKSLHWVWLVMVVFNAFIHATLVIPLFYMVLRERVIGFFEGFRWTGVLFFRTLSLLLLAFASFIPLLYAEGPILSSTYVKMYPELALIYLGGFDLWTILVNVFVHAILIGWLADEVRY